MLDAKSQVRGWAGVYKILKHDGYNVVVVQNPTITLADDVAVTKHAIDSVGGEIILVGHSYGGAVITQAGNDPKVAGLVYVTAFAPDKGESIATLIAHPAPGAPVPPILPPQNGFLMLDKSKFAEAFAADVNREVASFMANSQVPWGLGALNGAITEPAWKTKLSWYPGRDHRSHDPARRSTFHGATREGNDRRIPRQPRNLCLETRRRCALHREGGHRRESGDFSLKHRRQTPREVS